MTKIPFNWQKSAKNFFSKKMRSVAINNTGMWVLNFMFNCLNFVRKIYPQLRSVNHIPLYESNLKKYLIFPEHQHELHVPNLKGQAPSSQKVTAPEVNVYEIYNGYCDNGAGFIYLPNSGVVYSKIPPDVDFEKLYKYGSIVYEINNKKAAVKVNSSVIEIDNVIFLSGGQEKNYYHWTIEVASALPYLVEKTNFQEANYTIVVSEDINKQPNIKFSLSILANYYQLDYYLIPKDKVVKFKKLLTCDYLNYIKRVGQKGERLLFKSYFIEDSLIRFTKIIKKINRHEQLDLRKFPKKIFLKRSSSRRNYNENEIASYFSDLGYSIIDILEYKYFEQVILFENSTHIVSPTGAVLTNLIYCKPGTKVITWLPRSHSIFPCFETIGFFFKLEINSLFYDSHRRHSISANYHIPLDMFNDLGLMHA